MVETAGTRISIKLDELKKKKNCKGRPQKKDSEDPKRQKIQHSNEWSLRLVKCSGVHCISSWNIFIFVSQFALSNFHVRQTDRQTDRQRRYALGYGNTQTSCWNLTFISIQIELECNANQRIRVYKNPLKNVLCSPNCRWRHWARSHLSL